MLPNLTGNNELDTSPGALRKYDIYSDLWAVTRSLSKPMCSNGYLVGMIIRSDRKILDTINNPKYQRLNLLWIVKENQIKILYPYNIF